MKHRSFKKSRIKSGTKIFNAITYRPQVGEKDIKKNYKKLSWSSETCPEVREFKSWEYTLRLYTIIAAHKPSIRDADKIRRDVSSGGKRVLAVRDESWPVRRDVETVTVKDGQRGSRSPYWWNGRSGPVHSPDATDKKLIYPKCH